MRMYTVLLAVLALLSNQSISEQGKIARPLIGQRL